MKPYIFLFFLLLFFRANAQQVRFKMDEDRFTETEKYFSFNPLALAEPQIAIGAGFGNRFSKRSEYFAELSYVAKQPFYKYTAHKSLHGIRFIAQYRYHFLQQWRPLINLGESRRRRHARHNPFVGLEFRVKPFNFSANSTFVRDSPADTLTDFLYRAKAVSLGGALIFGETYHLSSDGKWKLEFTMGIGGKVKIVDYKNIPDGYKPFLLKGGWGLTPPGAAEAIGLPYFPCALRLRYVID